MSNKSKKGTKIEIDFDPQELGPDNWRNPNAENMERALRRFLFRSQIKCNVRINGELFSDKLRKGKHVRTIMSPDSEFEIGRVHILKSGNSKRFDGEVIYRIDGVPMLSRHISGDAQVIVELNKENHRKFLTSNRDGFKSEYALPVDELIDEIVSDNISALTEKVREEDYTVEGAMGDLNMSVDVSDIEFSSFDDEEAQEVNEIQANLNYEFNAFAYRERKYSDSDLVEHDIGIVSAEMINKFLENLRDDGGYTFLHNYLTKPQLDRLRDDLKHNGIKDTVIYMSKEISDILIAGLTKKVLDKQQERISKHTSIYNVQMKIENPEPVVRRVIKQFNPENWDAETGKGKQIRSLLEAWTAACQAATKELLMQNPHLGPFDLRTGWLFTQPNTVYVGDMSKTYLTEAMHQKDGSVHKLLLNPVDAKWKKIKYKTSSKEDLHKLLTPAAHEVTHMAVGPRHTEEFASVMTSLVCGIMPKTAMIIKDMKTRMDSAKANFDTDFARKDLGVYGL